MKMRIAGLAMLLITAAVPQISVAQSAQHGDVGYFQPGGSSQRDRGWQQDDRWDRDNERGDRWGHHRREGSVSIRNSRSRSISVQLRDSRGVVRSSFWLAPGQRRYVRADANSRWSVTVRQYKYYRKYGLDEIGSFDDGRWYVRIR